MTKEEALSAFREQVPVVLLPAPARGVYREIPCIRIEAVEYRILRDGSKDFTIKAQGKIGSVTYSGNPEQFRRVEIK